MLMPTGKPLFDNVSSKEYYTRANGLRDKALNACVHIVYPDFEEAILFAEGRAVTAIHQSNRWMTVGDELLEPAENKALAAEGRMAAYELPRRLLDVFLHKRVEAMVETELGPYMTADTLVRYLVKDKSTCVLKLEEGSATAYVFINFGNKTGAAFASPEGRLYDEDAEKALGRFKEHAAVTIYFTEFSAKYLKSKTEAKAEAPKPTVPHPAIPSVPAASLPEPMASLQEFMTRPPEPISPFPVAVARPSEKRPEKPLVKPAIKRPATTPSACVKLVVAMSEDRHISLKHRSRQQTLEALEEGDVAWVDGRTFTLLHLLDPNVRLILPDGREYAVTLKEAPIQSEESRYIIMPRKLRKRLSVAGGSMVEVKA